MRLLDLFLQDNEYVAGDQLSVADIVLATSAVCYTTIDFDMSKYKNVERWLNKIAAEVPKYNEIVDDGLERFKAWVHSVIKK